MQIPTDELALRLKLFSLIKERSIRLGKFTLVSGRESNYYLDGSLMSDTKPGDGLVVASGTNPDRETYVVTLKPDAGTWNQLGIDVVQDESLPGARYARGADRFLLSEVDKGEGGLGCGATKKGHKAKRCLATKTTSKSGK